MERSVKVKKGKRQAERGDLIHTGNSSVLKNQTTIRKEHELVYLQAIDDDCIQFFQINFCENIYIFTKIMSVLTMITTK